jgi:hypothetical protein
MDPEIDRIISYPPDDDGIEAGKFQFSTELPATGGFEVGAGKWGLEENLPTTNSLSIGARQNAGSEDKLILFSQGVNAWFQIIIQELDAEATSTNIVTD